MDSEIFQSWYDDFIKFIQPDLNNPNKKVVVIALSRKMPRLITWIKERFLSPEEANHFYELINSDYCIYTTEHAIPFVFSDAELLNCPILILDDMYVTGETIQGVSDEVFALTGHRPYFLSLYAYSRNFRENSVNSNLGTNISKSLPRLLDSIPEARNIMRHFSELIENTQLPIDMEFPILHLDREEKFSDEDGTAISAIIDNLRKSQPDSRYSEKNVNGFPVNFTQLIEKDINRLYNNDFAKLRVFNHEEEVRIVCYAPNILGDKQVLNPELFSNVNYHWLWKNLLENTISDPVTSQYDYIISDEDRLRHRLSYRLHKSLIVFANYMFSLSTMIRQKTDYSNPYQSFHAEIRRDDLALLVGPALANQYARILNGLYQNNVTSDSLRQELNLPALLVTDNAESEYNYLSTTAVFNEKTVESAIKKMIASAYSICSNYRKDGIPSETYILESFQSLYNKPSVKFQGLAGEMEINRVIDDLIDSGFLVPVYERVADENETLYWRRFFRATHTAPFLKVRL